MNRRQWLTLAGAAALGGLAGPARADAGYPKRPLRLLVPFLAGSAPDSTARVLAEGLRQRLGQPVVVENAAGAGGVIGAGMLKRAAPDGYTLGVLANTHVINVHTFRRPPYDPARDFTPIAALAGGPTVLAVPASAPYRSVADLVAALRRKPGGFSFGSGGKGSIAHLAVEMLLHQSGTRALHVPYKGATELVTAMLSGQTDFGMPVLGTAAQYLHNGQLRALAVSSPARSPYFPEVPTLAEALPPGFVIDNWSGLFAPAGLPAPLLQRLFAAVGQVQASGAFDTQLRATAGELRRSPSPAEFAALVAGDARRYGALMNEIGMEST